MATSFLGFLSERRSKKDWTVAKLAVEVGLSHGTVTKYLTGERSLPRARALVLRDALCDSAEERAEFDLLYEQSDSKPSDAPPPEGMNSELDLLRVVTLDFQPYSGCENCFMERFLRKMLNLAAIRMEMFDGSRSVELAVDSGEAFPSFDIDERIDWIEKGKADVLINLITPARMKGVVFTSTPIRIPINGVIFAKDAGRIEEAQILLVNGAQPSSDPFTVIAVEHEVAHMFLQQNGAFKGRPPDLVGTLDPKGLAKRMEQLRGQPVMLAVDEHTALGVIRELNGEELPAVLVLSPNSDAAVVNFEARKTAPAYYYGFGLKRNKNYDLVSYFTETMAVYLGLEPETISTWYAELYRELVVYLESCLRETVLYIGGLRMTGHRVTDTVPKKTNPAQWKRERLLLVEQNARAAARRTLSLSQRSLANLPRELIGWRTILQRASEQIRVYEAGDRDWIRNIVLYCAKMALGLDPLMVQKDSIQLLRMLSPWYEKTDQEKIAEDSEDDHWPDFLHLLARELDMNLSELNGLKEWKYRYFEKSRNLGELISKLQDILEGSADQGIVPTIREYRRSDREAFQELVGEYVEYRKKGDSDFSAESLLERKLPADDGKVPQPGGRYRRYVAYSLGLIAGFLDLEVLPIEGSEEQVTPPQIAQAARGEGQGEAPTPEVKRTMRVDHLFVSGHMHHTGVSRRLIRKIVEAGNETEDVGGIWLERYQWEWERAALEKSAKTNEKTNLEKFKRTGFVPLAGDYFRWFEFKRETKQRKPIKRPVLIQ